MNDCKYCEEKNSLIQTTYENICTKCGNIVYDFLNTTHTYEYSSIIIDKKSILKLQNILDSLNQEYSKEDIENVCCLMQTYNDKCEKVKIIKSMSTIFGSRIDITQIKNLLRTREDGEVLSSDTDLEIKKRIRIMGKSYGLTLKQIDIVESHYNDIRLHIEKLFCNMDTIVLCMIKKCVGHESIKKNKIYKILYTK
jgi:hypothetical protein